MRTAFRLLLLASILAAPLLAISQVRAGDDQFIGATHKFGNGSGLVIALGLQRG